MSSYQLTDSENNALVLLSSVTTDSEDGNELNVEKIGQFFNPSFDAMSSKITSKIITDSISLIKFIFFFIFLHEHFCVWVK